MSGARFEIARVIYCKNENGTKLKITAFFYSDGTHRFWVQDPWEVRSWPYAPSEQEVQATRTLAGRG